MGSSSTSSLGMGRRRRIEPFASYRTEGSSGIHRLRLGTLGIDDQDWSLDGQAGFASHCCRTSQRGQSFSESTLSFCVSPLTFKDDFRLRLRTWVTTLSLSFAIGTKFLDSPQQIVLELTFVCSSTDFDHYQALCPEDREAYSEWIIGRSERVYKFAVDYLDLTTPAYNPSPDFDLESVVIAAARENAFITAIVAASSIILLLSHDSPHSRVLSPILSCSLFNSSPPASAISALARASKQVLSVVRTTRNRFGSLLAFEPHCPCFGSSLLVAAFGLLVKAEASLVEAEQDEARLEAAFDAKPLEEDLNFCEQVLERQSKWPQAEMLRAELALMRSTSLFVEPPSQ